MYFMDYAVSFQKSNEYAKVPTKGSPFSAGYDLYAAIPEAIEILPGQVAKITTGLKIELPEKTFGAIFARSGLATKQGLAPANMVGICDSDYRGEYIVALRNYSSDSQIVRPGDRIAQLIILPYIDVKFIEAGSLEETLRGDGGFGHTGT